MRCRLRFQTLDKPLRQFFIWFADKFLVDYYLLFILLPILFTAILSLGFLRIEELTILDAKRLYTPASAPSWNEEKILSKVIKYYTKLMRLHIVYILKHLFLFINFN